MMIELYLSKRNYRKYKIVQTIYSNSNKICYQEFLMEQLETSAVTLVGLIDEINQDFLDLGYESTIKLLNSDKGGQKKYCLTVIKKHQLDQLMFHYLKDSLRFLLLVDIFFETLGDINDTAAKYYVSQGTLRKEIKYLESILADWNIRITTHPTIMISGPEISIRMFYSNLFLHSYSGIYWPFDSIPLNKIEYYLSIFSNQIFKTGPLENRLLAIYIATISIHRAKLKHLFLENNTIAPIYNNGSPDYLTAQSELIMFSRNFYFAPKQAVEREIQLQCSLFIAHNLIEEKTEVYNFFLNSPSLNGLNVWDYSLDITNKLYKNSPFQIDFSEYNTLTYEFCIINYKTMLLAESISIDYYHQEYERLTVKANKIDASKIEHIFISLIQPTIPLPLKNFENFLIRHYTFTFFNTVNLNKEKKKLKIMLMTQATSVNILNFFDTHRFLKNFNLSLVELTQNKPDIIISDFPLSYSNFYNDEQAPEVFCWDWVHPEHSLNELSLLIELKSTS